MKLPEAIKLFDQGSILAEQDARQLESDLESTPDDLATRIKLLGYYYSKDTAQNMPKCVRHVEWMIDNHPDAGITHLLVLTIPLRRSDKLSYEQIKAHWLAHLQSASASARTILNAADFFIANRDLESALACLPKLQDSAPKERDLSSVASLYKQLHERIGRSDHADLYQDNLLNEAIDWGHKAARLENEMKPEYLASIELVNLLFAGNRLDQAKSAAAGLLKQANESGEKHGYALHISRIVLGKIALLEGDSTLALYYLAASADVPNSPFLWSKGPDLSLARALLEAGETPSVLGFLDCCMKLNLSNETFVALRQWRSAIVHAREL